MTVFPRVSPFLLLFNVVTAPLGSALRCARPERGGAIIMNIHMIEPNVVTRPPALQPAQRDLAVRAQTTGKVQLYV